MSENEMTGNVFFFQKRKEQFLSPPKFNNVDDLIVEKILSGDDEAFGDFYRKFLPLVHGIVLARVPYDEVSDIVQEVFIAAFNNLKNLREPKASGAWLAMIARNRANEYYRRIRPTEELHDNIREKSCMKHEAGEILEIIKSLPAAYSETLILRLVEGLTGPEISALTGLTPESVRVNLHRGMKLLRQKIGVEG